MPPAQATRAILASLGCRTAAAHQSFVFARALKAGAVMRIAERPTGFAPLDRRIDRARGRREPDPRPLVDRVAAQRWFHSIDLGGGVVTPGVKSAERLALELREMRLPDLAGRSVLDIGAWDGYFSFACERAGAARVVALDHYAWSIDWAEVGRYATQCHAAGRPPDPWNRVPGVWRPWRLPGRRGFEIAREALGSRVEAVVGDLATMPPGRLGAYDVVLFLGVLYHLEDPLRVLRRVADLTAGLAVIETEAVALHGHPDRALVEFFPGDELAGDPTNWWAPTRAALVGLCAVAGFREVETVVGPPAMPTPQEPVLRYRLVVHARR